MINFPCQHCTRELEVDGDLAGQKAKCPFCGEINIVPAASTSAEEPGIPVARASSRRVAPVVIDDGTDEVLLTAHPATIRARPLWGLAMLLLLGFGAAGAVYFFVVTPINALIARMRKAPAPADPTTKKCPECLSEIPIDARRCGFCTQPLTARAA